MKSIMELALEFTNEELGTAFTAQEFKGLCSDSFWVNTVWEKVIMNKTEQEIKQYHTDNIFMFFRCCFVNDDEYHEKRLEFTKQVIGESNKILDFGAGIGDITDYLIQQGKDVDYYDINKYCVKFVKKNYPHINIIENIEKVSTTYDAIICMNVAQYLPNEKTEWDIFNKLCPASKIIFESSEASNAFIKKYHESN